MNSQLRRGIMDICVMQLLNESDRYGYDLIKELQGFFPDVEESVIYALLRRLSRGTLVDTYYGDVSRGPQRKYYTITKAGQERLAADIASWREINRILARIGVE